MCTASHQPIVYEPIEDFLPAIEATIAQRDITGFNEYAHNKVDHFLQSVYTLPRESFETLFDFNAKTVMGSRLAESLKTTTIEYLKKMQADYFSKFDKEVEERTTAINNYKIVLNAIKKERDYHEKFFEQAPIVASSMNDNLFSLARSTKEIVSKYINEMYTITVDTLTNEAINWHKNADGEAVWSFPEQSHKHLMPFGTSVPDELLMRGGPLSGTIPGAGTNQGFVSAPGTNEAFASAPMSSFQSFNPGRPQMQSQMMDPR